MTKTRMISPHQKMSMRNYKKEYETYHSKPEQKVRRAARNAARRLLKDRKGIKGKDVHHKDNNPENNDKENLSVVTQNYNRKEPRMREDMGTTTGAHIAGTGDDSSTVLVKKKKRILKRIKDTANYNKKGGHNG